MWVAKWKWAVAGCAVLVLTAGGALAALLRPAPEAPKLAPVPNAEPLFAPRVPAPVPEPKKEPPKAAWEVATKYLQLIVDGKPEEAEKLGDRPGVDAGEITRAGLKRVKLVMILINDLRVMVVTEHAKLKRRPNAEPTDEHVTVTLARKDAVSPWRVIENDVADEKKVLREVGDYLEGKFSAKPDARGAKPDGGEPQTNWDVAIEFLRLALAEKTADALKLTVPGTISENKVGEIKKAGATDWSRPVVVLLNDARIEAAFWSLQGVGVGPQGGLRVVYLVPMLTKSKDGAWLVKDIDARDTERLEERVKLYLAGAYDEKPAKK